MKRVDGSGLGRKVFLWFLAVCILGLVCLIGRIVSEEENAEVDPPERIADLRLSLSYNGIRESVLPWYSESEECWYYFLPSGAMGG